MSMPGSLSISVSETIILNKVSTTDTSLHAFVEMFYHEISVWHPNLLLMFQCPSRLTVSNALVRSTKVLRHTLYTGMFCCSCLMHLKIALHCFKVPEICVCHMLKYARRNKMVQQNAMHRLPNWCLVNR